MISRPRKLELAHVPTPIEAYPQLLPGLWVKRDDLTGCELSGNKVRKLEYLAAEALDLGCDTLVTAGAVQSNHARATAIVAARLGLCSVLVLEGPAADHDWAMGNAFLDRFVGAEIDWQAEPVPNLSDRMERVAERLRAQGRRPYLIPVGGSSELGTWGYIDAAAEAKRQCDALGLRIDRVVCTAGSCGTYVGLLLGIKLAGWPVRLTGIGISSTADKKLAWARDLAERSCARYRFPITVEPGDLEVFDYAGAGYAMSRADEIACIADVARRSGLLLDPVYTGKTYYGMLDLARQGAIRADEHVLFFHTGGLFGLLAKSADVLRRTP
jgi:D-cysteine desulfhydrase family pyridoxal phosphate-dependent enzyme